MDNFSKHGVVDLRSELQYLSNMFFCMTMFVHGIFFGGNKKPFVKCVWISSQKLVQKMRILKHILIGAYITSSTYEKNKNIKNLTLYLDFKIYGVMVCNVSTCTNMIVIVK